MRNTNNPKVMKEIIRIYQRLSDEGKITAAPAVDDYVPNPLDVCVQKDPTQWIPCLYAEPYEEGDTWRFYTESESYPLAVENRSDGLIGEHFFERNKAVYHIRKDESSVKVFDAILRIVHIREIFEPNSEKKVLITCRISSAVWYDDDTDHLIEVEKRDFKRLLFKVHETYPEISIMKQYCAVFEEYLSMVFQKRPQQETTKEARLLGWASFMDPPRYVIGVDSFYRNYRIPDVTYLTDAFPLYTARKFLDIGHEQFQISTLWVAAHLPFLMFWFEKVDIHFHSVFYLQGETNSFKTTVCSLIANVFNTDRERAVFRLTSTKAGLQHIISNLPDTLVCLDDFSNTESSSRAKAKDVAETILRAVGDGQFSAKMDITKSSKVLLDAVRTVVIMTGEDTIGLSQSSEYRMITIPLHRGVFDSQKLQYFEDTPSYIPEYFAMFVKFLERTLPKNLSTLKNRFRELQSNYRKTLEVPRLVNANVVLHLTAEIVGQFYCNGGKNDLDADVIRECLEDGIDETFRITAKISRQKAPEQLFLEAISKIASTKALPIAESEDWYVKNSRSYAGFKDSDGNLWLLPDKAYIEVRNSLKNQNVDFLTDLNTLKKRLFQNGISIGRYDEKGHKNEYLCRGHRPDQSGLRKRFLVIRRQKIEEILNKTEE